MKLSKVDRWRMAGKHKNGIALMRRDPLDRDRLIVRVYPNYIEGQPISTTYWMDIAKKKYPTTTKGIVISAMDETMLGSWTRPNITTPLLV